jgi:hypothetical protein
MTEQTYVSRLDLLMQVYYKPLLGMGDSVFNQRIVKSIFSQVRPLPQTSLSPRIALTHASVYVVCVCVSCVPCVAWWRCRSR